MIAKQVANEKTCRGSKKTVMKDCVEVMVIEVFKKKLMNSVGKRRVISLKEMKI